jgi:hypothetical protein
VVQADVEESSELVVLGFEEPGEIIERDGLEHRDDRLPTGGWCDFVTASSLWQATQGPPLAPSTKNLRKHRAPQTGAHVAARGNINDLGLSDHAGD